MSAAARFFDLLTRGGATACLIRIGLLIALPVASISSSTAGVVFWLLTIVCLMHVLQRRPLDVQQRRPRDVLPLSPGMLWLAASASLLPLALNIGSVWWYGLAARNIAWTPLLAFVVIMVATRRVSNAIEFWLAGAVLGAATVFAMTTVAVLWFHHDRPSLTMNALLYGKMALLAMIVCGWGLRVIGTPWRRAMLWLAILAGLFALVTTGYRGGFLVLPVVVIAALAIGSNRTGGNRTGGNRISGNRISANRIGKSGIKVWRLSLIIAGAVAVITIAGSNVAMLERMQKASTELELYQRGEIKNSSIGSRLSMWVAAATIYRDKPVFGIGTHRFHDVSKTMQERGLYPRDAKLYRHAHNSYLNVAAEYGTIGIVVMLLALLALLRLCGSLAPPVRSLALLTLSGWLLMALTNDIFAHQNLLRMLVLSIAVAVGGGLAQSAIERA